MSEIHELEELIDNIHYGEYNDGWAVSSSLEFDEWFSSLDEQGKEAVLSRVYLLQEFGPDLGRPYVDTLKGSKVHKNIKELRCQSQEHVLRVAFYFDPDRRAFLLIGGDKKGISGDKFYKELLRKAEAIIEGHEKEQEEKRK
jgi:hypothetical protein